MLSGWVGIAHPASILNCGNIVTKILENNSMLNIEDKCLKKFSVFTHFSDEQLLYIKDKAKMLDVPPNKVLLKLGAEHTNQFFLLKGCLKLKAADGKESIIEADTPSAANPVAQLRPSRYQVSTCDHVVIIVISENDLSNAIEMDEAEEIDIGATTVEESGSEHEEFNSVLFQILSLLHTDQFKLPSLPDIAIKIRHAAEDPDSDIDSFGKIVKMDPSIVAKIMKTANSVIYNPAGNKIVSCKEACVRIGVKKLVNLVLSYAMKELFDSDSERVRKKMQDVWHHSVYVAAISSILARMSPPLDPEVALLSGLLHNIGNVAVLNNLGDKEYLIENDDTFCELMLGLQAAVGVAILEKWEFPEQIIEVVKNSTNFDYDSDPGPDYCDLVNIAQLHAYIGTVMQEKLPNIDEIPAFHKLADGQLTPELSLQLIEKSRQEIEEIIHLFN